MTMKNEKKLTYVSLEEDESIHEEYERALDRVKPDLGKAHPLHIGEEEIHSLPEFEVRAPFDPSILVGKFQTASPDLIRSAIIAANHEFPAWEEKGWKERVKILRRTANILEKNRFILAALITYEAGKTRNEAIAEVSEAVDMIRYHAAIYTKNRGTMSRCIRIHRQPGARA